MKRLLGTTHMEKIFQLTYYANLGNKNGFSIYHNLTKTFSIHASSQEVH